MDKLDSDRSVELPLDKAVEYMLEECRMILPGIQALFGFQLIAVFSERFDKTVDASGKHLHLTAILFVVVAIGLIMAPAALHRMTNPRRVSQRYLKTCTHLILGAMVPLATAIVIETWLVADALLHAPAVAGACAAVSGLVFIVFWWVFPLSWQRNQLRSRTGES